MLNREPGDVGAGSTEQHMVDETSDEGNVEASCSTSDTSADGNDEISNLPSEYISSRRMKPGKAIRLGFQMGVNQFGAVMKAKSRVVVRGFSKKVGVDYFKTS